LTSSLSAAAANATLLDCARQLSVNLVSICGSGLLDVVAQRRLNHVLAERPALETITVSQRRCASCN